MIQTSVPPPPELESDPRVAGRARSRSRLLVASAALALLALGFGTLRTQRLERAEFEFTTPPATLHDRMQQPNASRISARMGQVALAAGQFAVFEICSADRFEPARWQGALEFAVLQLEAKKLMLRVALDAAHLARVHRNSQAACLQLGSGPIDQSGTYSVEAVWSESPKAEVADTPLVLRVLAKHPLTAQDRASVYVFAFATVACLWFALAAAPQLKAASEFTLSGHSSRAPLANRAVAVRFASAAVAIGLLYALSQLPAPGSTWTLAKGALLFSLQVALAWSLARSFAPGHVAEALGLVAPSRPAIALASAIGAWPMLVAAARFALRLVPSTGEAPIQSFIAWPSGMLAVALLGVLLPAAEELFFRGYLYGALLPLGRLGAAALSVCLFGLLHAEQSWGNWGGLFAVFSAGAVLCAVRVVSGSTLLSALTHVAYNLTLSLTSIAASAG